MSARRAAPRTEKSAASTRPKAKPAHAGPAAAGACASDVASVLAWLKRHGSEKVRAGMARYAIPSDHALGVPMSTIQALGKQLGRDHTLAHGLWKTGVYEARLLVSFVADPARLTAAEMERWCRDFDNWAIVDTLCFKLFDQCPPAWSKVGPWSERADEFQKRAGPVLLACLAAHDETAPDEKFFACLPAMLRAAEDERNFVRKGVSWALRMTGRRSPALHAAMLAIAKDLLASPHAAAKRTAREVERELLRPDVKKKVAAKTPPRT